MNSFTEFLPFIIPIAVVEIALILFALIDLMRKKKTRNLNIGLWVAIILLLNGIGPILYFFIGKEEI